MTSTPPAAVAEPAPAKLNLYLHVVGRRADGYHLLDSLVAFTEYGDALRAAPASDLTLRLDGPFAPALESEATSDNLALKAAAALRLRCGASGASLVLTKNLPVAAGLGGGSADAAAALRALVRLWQIDPDRQALSRLALGLGADVPACLLGRPSAASGIGEMLAPAPPLPAVWLVLVNPGVAVPTKEVFAARTGPYSALAPLDRAPADAAELARLLKERRNDLAAPAQRIAPSIAAVLAALETNAGCLLARMSGSGATCFGLFATADGAAAAAAAIARQRPDWWSVAAALRC